MTETMLNALILMESWTTDQEEVQTNSPLVAAKILKTFITKYLERTMEYFAWHKIVVRIIIYVDYI